MAAARGEKSLQGRVGIDGVFEQGQDHGILGEFGDACVTAAGVPIGSVFVQDEGCGNWREILVASALALKTSQNKFVECGVELRGCQEA